VQNESPSGVMTCCTTTAYHYRKIILPYADQHILEKNKLHDDIFSSGWTWGHLHVEVEVEAASARARAHDVIINRKIGVIDLHDSFIDYRTISKRTYSEAELHKLWSIFINPAEPIYRRMGAFNTLFDAPSSYISGWTGKCRYWLVQLS
jgi:hypothetical protein